ncbi:hypothetical protein GGG16DRAFT_108651 [Schizophyllum commune]
MHSPAIYDTMHEWPVPPEFQTFPVVDDDGTASLWPRNSPDGMVRPLPSQKTDVLWQLHCPDKCMPPVAIPEPMTARLLQRSVRAAFTKMPRMKRDAPYAGCAQAGREPSDSPPSHAVVPDLQPSSPMSAKSTDSPRRGPDTPVDTPINCPRPLASPLLEEMFRGLNLSAYDSDPASPVQRCAMFPGPEARDEEMPLGLYVDGDLQEQQLQDHSGMSLDGLGEGFGYLQNMDVQQEQLPTPPQSASTTDFPTSAFTFEPAHAPMPGFPSEPVPGFPSEPVPGFPSVPVPGFPSQSMHAFDHPHVPAYDFSLFDFSSVDEPAPPFTPSTSAPSSGSAYTPTDSSEHSSMGVDSCSVGAEYSSGSVCHSSSNGDHSSFGDNHSSTGNGRSPVHAAPPSGVEKPTPPLAYPTMPSILPPAPSAPTAMAVESNSAMAVDKAPSKAKASATLPSPPVSPTTPNASRKGKRRATRKAAKPTDDDDDYQETSASASGDDEDADSYEDDSPAPSSSKRQKKSPKAATKSKSKGKAKEGPPIFCPFRDYGCMSTFTRPGDVKRHILETSKHPIAELSPDALRMFKIKGTLGGKARCPECGRQLSRKDALMRHLERSACGRRRKLDRTYVQVPVTAQECEKALPPKSN